MLRNYIKTTFRNLKRNFSNALINVFGLSLGLACGIVLMLLADYHTNYDAHHKNKDRIFRVVTSADGQGGERDNTPGVPTPFPDAIRNDFPEIEEVSFVTFAYGSSLITIDTDNDQPRYFEEDAGIAFVDQPYLNTFDIDWVSGDKSNALVAPNSAVISKKWAEKYFPDGDALNNTLEFNDGNIMTITGIMESPPVQSDFPFELYFSLSSIKDDILKNGWGSVSSDDQCYVLLSDSQEVSRIETQLEGFVIKYFGEHNNNKILKLQPLSDIHRNEQYSNYNYKIISDANILGMRLIAIFLVLTACVNFINLSTAMAVKRSREVGVRKVLGGTRLQLIKQFLGESFVIVMMAMAIALGLAELIVIYLNPFMDVSLAINITSPIFLAAVFGLGILITFLAGFYPALVLSGFKPVLAIKNTNVNRSSGGLGVRKGLVVFQFFISQIFVIGTIVVITQLNFIRDQDLGFKTDALINVEIPEKDNLKKKTLKTEISRIAGVDNVSLIFSNPTSGSVSVTNFGLPEDDSDYLSALKYGDGQYMEIFNIEMVAGSPLGQSDSINQLVVNEEWVRYANIASAQDAVGTIVKIHGRDVPIVGVMKNFYSMSLRDKLSPIILMNSLNTYRRVAVKVNLTNIEAVTADIKKAWKSLYPQYDFEYRFVDEQLAEFYEGEKSMATIFGFFSFIAIVIGGLGLFGLASFMVNQKVKEIGVRKVLGASVASIIGLFSKEYMVLIIISFAFAAPFSWYFMDLWLQNFEYRIEIGALIFLAGIFTTIIISLTTVGYKSLRAATSNPVDSLRVE